MIRIFLLTLASVATLIGANEYCEQHYGKGLLAQSGIERYLDRKLSPSGTGRASLVNLVATGFKANNSLGGCQ
ncbi:hypothetical protein [Limnoglobus roseus]|uniref:Uncharacterized protein n=1 Tax=Limnoglobus roseus TaxID=2598579 RepID=A0A5C1AQK1_9BACT|nr:hypothetical protein [Limnoglobus roseus]QEL20895.1 hypothetical protein PX52LOC_08016 [Limnoglobus roseus]